jgi:hypothetical protein
MKQFAFVTLVSALMFGALGLPALSQSSDTIDVTMSPQVLLSVSVDMHNVDYPSLPLSTPGGTRSTFPMASTITATNTSNIPADLVISGTDATSSGTPWTLNCEPSDTGTVAMDQYVHQFWRTVPTSTPKAALCTTDQSLADGVASNDTVGFRLELNMPTGTSDYGVHSSSVVVTAVQP